MKYKIPKTFMGKPIEGAMERVLSKSQQSQATQPDDSSQPFEFKNPNIVAHDYVQIPQLKKVISGFELLGYNNLNWQEEHFKLHENGLYMPIIPEFMTHFRNVVESYKSKGKKPLFDAKGNPFSKEEVKDMYLHLTKDHIARYASQGGSQKGAWTWLDALFEQKQDGLYVLTEHRTEIKNGNKELVPKKIEKLETCLMKDCFADFNSLNSQGLPTIESGDKYRQGENIKFWKSVNGCVARFYAYSDWANLFCDRYPSNSYSDLGVFGVADAGS